MKNILKELEGKVVYLRPTGNNARGGRGKEAVVATVVKVARVNVTLEFNTGEYYTRQEKIKFDGNSLDNGHNGGYVVYKTMQEFDDYFKVTRLGNAIHSEYPHGSYFERVSLIDLELVARVLGVDIPDAD